MYDRCVKRREKHRWLHGSLTVVWVLLIIPTLLWWPESILWVAFMSLYANIVGHWSAFEAASAQKEE